jgi:hypothetical protein
MGFQIQNTKYTEDIYTEMCNCPRIGNRLLQSNRNWIKKIAFRDRQMIENS